MNCPNCKDGNIKMNAIATGAIYDLTIKLIDKIDDRGAIGVVDSELIQDTEWECGGYECESCGEEWIDKKALKDSKPT